MPAYLWITVAAAAAFVFWIGWGIDWWRSVLYSWARARHVIELTQSEPVPAPEYGSMIWAEEKLIMPRLGGHLRVWGSGHTCSSDSPHDNCVCECGIPAPYDDAPEWLPAPPVDPAPWLAQTMADLAPEALDEIVLPDAGGWISGPCLDDSGPGDDLSSLASSGPDQFRNEAPGSSGSSWGGPGVAIRGGDHAVSWPGDEWPSVPGPAPSRWLAEQLEILHAWSERQQRYAEILA